jgi:transcriptional regulator with XRE-family HTH domain
MSDLYPLSSSDSHAISLRRKVSGQVFGELIQKARVADGRPLEEIAPLAGLTVSEWMEIEAGQVPDTVEHICLLANALGLSQSWKSSVVNHCVETWGTRR